MSDVSPQSGISGLSFDSTLLSTILFFCLILLLFLSSFFCVLVHSPELFPEPLKGGRGCLMSPPCLESQGCQNDNDNKYISRALNPCVSNKPEA